MTGLLLTMLWLVTTGITFQPLNRLEVVSDQIVQEQMQQEQAIQDEIDRNYQAEQEEIIIEDYFLFLKKIGKINYARGCMGEYSKPIRSNEKQKRVKCASKSYDCAGLIKWYAVAKGILTQDEAAYNNSQTIVLLWQPKDAYTAKRWDRTSWQGFGKNATWNSSTHFAIISRDYTGGNILWVYDNANGPSNNIIAERPIKVAYVNGKFYYLGSYRISVYTNWLVEEAQRKWITVERWVDTDEEVVEPQPLSVATWILELTGKASWYDYELWWEARSKTHSTCAMHKPKDYWLYKVTNLDNWKSVFCFNNDYMSSTEKVIDLSSYAFKKLWVPLSKWVVNVSVLRIK